MIVIPKKPREYRALIFIRSLPVSLQVFIVLILLIMAWNFRYFESGVDASRLKKVSGILYEVSCMASIKGSDTIKMRTSLQPEIITFSGWQKCDKINWNLISPDKENTAVFYTEIRKAPLNKDSKGSLWVHAVDLVSPYEYKFIYPRNGLVIENEPNIFGIFFLFMAVLITHGIWTDFFEKRAKSRDIAGPDK